MSYFLGVDGGGSSLRIVVTDTNQHVIARLETETANPSVIGWDEATKKLQNSILQVLESAKLTPQQIRGVGVGIAGASVKHSSDWLTRTCTEVLPDSLIVPSSDVEVALVGAHGKRAGGIIVAGTGSVGFYIDRDGNGVQIGGWGYLIGDEGSGYWIGRHAVSLLSYYFDGRLERTPLIDNVINMLEIRSGAALIEWLYKQGKSPVREIAQLAPIILVRADAGDTQGYTIIQKAASALVDLARSVQKHLPESYNTIALYGGLLQNDTLLRREVITQLGEGNILTDYQYPADVGAALLAQLRVEHDH